MNILLNIFWTLVAFLSMEAVAWLAHRYIMHGLLWSLHRDHHKKDTYGFFEKNDYFFLIFAFPGIVCFLIGAAHDYDAYFFIGLGITIYGAAYFFVHDVFIHQRIKWLRRSDSLYFRAIRRAHKMHHKHLGKKDGECFGMLWVPLKYFREASKERS